MNNSKLEIDFTTLETEEEKADIKPLLRQRETELATVVDAITRVSATDDWMLLQDRVFNGVVEGLKKQRDAEVEKKPLNGPMIHSLNGQLAWAKKFTDLTKLADIYKLELSNIRKKLNGN